MVRGRGTLTKSWHLNSVSIYRMKCLLLSWKAAKKFDGGHRTGNWTKRPDNNLQKELKVHYVVSYVLSFCVETQPQGVFVFHHLDPPHPQKEAFIIFNGGSLYTHNSHSFGFVFFLSPNPYCAPHLQKHAVGLDFPSSFTSFCLGINKAPFVPSSGFSILSPSVRFFYVPWMGCHW